MKSKEALEMEQEQLEIEPSLSNLTSLENATKEQMVKLFEQINKNKEEAGISQPLTQNRQPQNAPSISGASLQLLQTFAAEAEARGPQQARTSQVPTPDWQTSQTGLPVTNQSAEPTSND